MRLTALSITTFGFYELFWFYQNWRRERDRLAEDLSPFWRTLFAPLWSFSLFERFDGACARQGLPRLGSPTLLAVAYLVLSSLWRLPDPYWLVTCLTVLPLLPANSAAAGLNRSLAPSSPALAPWSTGTVILVVVGVVFFALALVGTFLPPESAQP